MGNVSLTIIIIMCNDPNEIEKSIEAYPDNYQELINAFDPMNWDKPFSVIIAYFVNYTMSCTLQKWVHGGHILKQIPTITE